MSRTQQSAGLAPTIIEAKATPCMPVWTAADSHSARLEGWDVFKSTGSLNGDWQVQCLDDPGQASVELGVVVPTIVTDEGAWRLVYEGIQPHHTAARVFLQTHNPKEWAAIEKVCVALNPRHRFLQAHTES